MNRRRDQTTSQQSASAVSTDNRKKQWGGVASGASSDMTKRATLSSASKPYQPYSAAATTQSSRGYNNDQGSNNNNNRMNNYNRNFGGGNHQTQNKQTMDTDKRRRDALRFVFNNNLGGCAGCLSRDHRFTHFSECLPACPFCSNTFANARDRHFPNECPQCPRDVSAIGRPAERGGRNQK